MRKESYLKNPLCDDRVQHVRNSKYGKKYNKRLRKRVRQKLKEE